MWTSQRASCLVGRDSNSQVFVKENEAGSEIIYWKFGSMEFGRINYVIMRYPIYVTYGIYDIK